MCQRVLGKVVRNDISFAFVDAVYPGAAGQSVWDRPTWEGQESRLHLSLTELVGHLRAGHSPVSGEGWLEVTAGSSSPAARDSGVTESWGAGEQSGLGKDRQAGTAGSSRAGGGTLPWLFVALR